MWSKPSNIQKRLNMANKYMGDTQKCDLIYIFCTILAYCFKTPKNGRYGGPIYLISNPKIDYYVI